MPRSVIIAPKFSSLAVPPVSRSKIRWDAVLTLARMSEIAYLDSDAASSAAKAIGAKDVQLLENEDHQGVVAADDKAVVIAFRGTASRRHIVSDILGISVNRGGGNVHFGFHLAVESLFDIALAEARRMQATRKTVWVTGHSLGGAIAAGTALKAVRECALRVDGVYTFGQPLIMDGELCHSMNAEFDERYIRFVNGCDPVATLVRPYMHAGARARLTDDGDLYEWRPPMVAPCAFGPEAEKSRRERRKELRRQRHADPELETHDFEEELPLISLQDAEALSQAIQAIDDPNVAPVGAAPGAFGFPFVNHLVEHEMSGYLSKIREIASARSGM